MQSVKVENMNKVNCSLNIDFLKEYDNWDKKNIEGSFLLGITSEPLQSIGLDNRNIIMDKTKILQIQHDHTEMTDSIIKQIPNILENPIIILNSQSKSNKNNNRIVVFDDVLDSNNNPVLVAMELKPKENKKTGVNKIYKVASAYGKENKNVIQKWFSKKENILYVDSNKKRTIMWLDGLGLQLSVPSNSGSLENNISYSNDNVNYFIEEEITPYNIDKSIILKKYQKNVDFLSAKVLYY